MVERSEGVLENLRLPRDEKRFLSIPPWWAPKLDILNDPSVVSADEAELVKDDDLVLGIVRDGKARAYPLWILYWYHTVNDALGGEPVAAFSCDRCGTAQVFRREIDGDVLDFHPAAFSNGTLQMMDRQTKSVWHHYEGVGITGEHRGSLLEWIPSFRTTWKRWRDMHPDTGIVTVPDTAPNDLRVGHGRDEHIERNGVVHKFLHSQTRGPDHRLHENRLVVAVNVPQGVHAYPLKRMKAHDSVVNDTIGDRPIVVWNGPEPDALCAAAFSRDIEAVDKPLTFEPTEEEWMFRDTQTGSLWNMEGAAVAGELEGMELRPVFHSLLRWHSSTATHKDITIYEPEEQPEPSFSDFDAVIQPLREAGYDVVPEQYGRKFALEEPPRSEAGRYIRIEGDRFVVERFESVTAAIDYAHFHNHTIRSGRYVLQSRPESIFANEEHSVVKDTAVIDWSRLLKDDKFVAVFEDAAAEEPTSDEPTFRRVVERLEAAGYDIVVRDVGRTTSLTQNEVGAVPFLFSLELPPGARNGIHAVIERDNFNVYRFDSASAAAAYADRIAHAFSAGRFVFRSVPVDRWRLPVPEMGLRDPEDVSWSSLLEDDSFVTTVRNSITG